MMRLKLRRNPLLKPLKILALPKKNRLLPTARPLAQIAVAAVLWFAPDAAHEMHAVLRTVAGAKKRG